MTKGSKLLTSDEAAIVRGLVDQAITDQRKSEDVSVDAFAALVTIRGKLLTQATTGNEKPARKTAEERAAAKAAKAADKAAKAAAGPKHPDAGWTGDEASQKPEDPTP